MAGRPKQRALAQALEQRAREAIGENATPLDYVVAWVASGKTQLSLVKEISAESGLDIMHATLARYLKDKYGDDATARLDVARREGAHVMVDDAIDIIETADDTSREALQHAKMRADIRLWTAGKFNRETYGENKAASISISIGGLHLNALRQQTATAVIIDQTANAQLPAGSIETAPSHCTLPDIEIEAE